jgi:hypothetical protein
MQRTAHDEALSHLHADIYDQIDTIRRVTADLQRTIAVSRTSLRESRDALRRANRELSDADPSAVSPGAGWRA